MGSVVRTGLADSSQLDGADALQFEFWFATVINVYDNAYYQYRVGLLDEDRWQRHLAGLKATFTRWPGARQWWATAEYMFSSPEFFALVEEILGEEPEHADRPQ